MKSPGTSTTKASISSPIQSATSVFGWLNRKTVTATTQSNKLNESLDSDEEGDSDSDNCNDIDSENEDLMHIVSDDEMDIDQCYDLGANSYIHKPVSLENFIESIKRLKEYWFEIVILPKTSE